MPSLDIFTGNAFSFTALVAAVDKVPFVPGAAGKLGIFDEEGVYTTTIYVEERNGRLYLIPNTPRGGPAFQNTRDGRDGRYFKTLHLPVRDHISADEIQNKRAFGSETELDIAKTEVDSRLTKMMKSHDATVEFGRIGALRGRILDANGATVLYDLFNEFGVVQQQQDYALGTNTSNILGLSTAVRGMIQDELGGDGGDEITVTAFCGAQWFATFIAHPKVAQAYQYYQTVQANLNPLQMDLRYVGFKFGGITYVQYRGQVNGIPFVPANEAIAFPVDVPGIYKTYYAPADYMETANTQGRPRYAKMAADPSGFNKFVALETQSNPLSLCLRPRVLIRIITSN